MALATAALAALPSIAHATLPTATGTAIPLADPQYSLWIPSNYVSRGNVADLMVFYHGDPATVRNNLQYSNLNTILLTVNLGGFSSSYQTPYQGHPELFKNVIAEARTILRARPEFDDNLNWDKVNMSTFSAGWAAAREILKDATNYNTIGSYAALDTIYASFTSSSNHTPLASQMVDFKKFALDAKNGNKTMVLNHTKVLTGTYANTEECANDINSYIGVTPTAYTTPGLGNMPFYRNGSAGNYMMYGMTGADGPAHSLNLQQSGQFFAEMPLASKDFTIAGATTYTFDVGLSSGLAYTGATTGSTISGQVQLPKLRGDHTLNISNGTAASDLTISNRVWGWGNLVKTGAGTLTLSGSTANVAAGETRVEAGVLELNKTAGINAVASNLAANSGGTARWLASNQVPDSATLTTNANGSTLDLNGKTESAANLNMTGGTMAIGAGALTLSGAITINTIFPSAYITGAGTVIAPALNINSYTTRNGGGVTRITSANFTLAAGKRFDLADTRFISKADVGSWNGTAYTGLTGLIAAGRNGGAWNNAGIITTMTAANASNQLTTLAIASNATLGKSTFGGQTVSGTDVLIMYTYIGDANLDGALTGDDYFRIDNGFQSHLTGYVNGDFDYNGRVDADDYFLIDRNYARKSTTYASSLPADGLGASAVPEPGAGMLALVAATAMTTYRRRKSRG